MTLALHWFRHHAVSRTLSAYYVRFHILEHFVILHCPVCGNQEMWVQGNADFLRDQVVYLNNVHAGKTMKLVCKHEVIVA